MVNKISVSRYIMLVMQESILKYLLHDILSLFKQVTNNFKYINMGIFQNIDLHYYIFKVEKHGTM